MYQQLECISIYLCVSLLLFVVCPVKYMQSAGSLVTHNRDQVISKEHIILSRLLAETKEVDVPFVAAENKAQNVQVLH